MSAAARTLALAALGMLLASCSWFHHGARKCREPQMRAGFENRGPLVVPPGLDAPDTRGAVRIPALNEPETPRAPTDPCLSAPPDYKPR